MNSATSDGWNSASRIGVSPAIGRSRDRTFAERVLGLFTTVQPGEARSVGLFSVYAFVLLICYYVLKTIREPLLLAHGSAALKSYACAAIAAVLLVAVPLYGALFRRTDRRQLIRWITLFFAANLVLFYALGRAGVDVGFAYYVWVSVFGVAILAQFWAHAAHSYNVDSGQRVFPLVMAGAALGALVGPPLSGALYPLLGPWNLMLIAVALLTATVPLVGCTSRAVPETSRNAERAVAEQSPSHPLGGLALVLGNRYLLLLALLAVLLNCVNTTGEYVLTDVVIRDADRQIAAHSTLDKAQLIASFYGHYYFTVNALSTLVQMLLVGRIFRSIGVHGATLVLPIIAAIGYGAVVFFPVFAVIKAVKILENSTDYSIMNTARQALYLPLPAREQYEGKTAVDTFFWRLGDVAQAGLIYAGLHWFGFDARQFALLNVILALSWIVVAAELGKRYPHRRAERPWRALKLRPVALGIGVAVLAAAALAAPRGAGAAAVGEIAALRAPGASDGPIGAAPLFADDDPLAMELVFDSRALCRRTDRADCADAPATLVVAEGSGSAVRVDVRLRVRGIWRNEAGHCSVPPLFVFFEEGATGTPFEGQKMLPLTTHCRAQAGYEQYVVKEYLAYRIYNLLSEKSLLVRLARITYRDAASHGRPEQRYAFFTEHFESLAARRHARLATSDEYVAAEADPREAATFALFQYLIGNTDWSALKGHNVTYLADSAHAVTAVPFDFDFSGLVDASYAGPPPGLPIRSVTQRLFRGSCAPGFDWGERFEYFSSRRAAIEALLDRAPGLIDRERAKASRYVAEFFTALDSPRASEIVRPCRALAAASAGEP